MVRLVSSVWLACSIVAMVPGTAARAQLEQLALRVPSSANALVVVDIKSTYSSPLARAEGWNPTGLKAHQSGMISLPAQAEVFLMAAEMDFEFLQPLWEISVAAVRQMPAMKDIAVRSGGRLDRVAGSNAVERPNDSYVAELGPKVIGAMSPANRQQVSRWLRESRRRRSADLSPYLTETVDVASEPSNPIVLALDLQGLLSATEVAETLAELDALIDKQSNLNSLSEVIASIRGVRLTVQLQSPAQGRLTLDFERDAEILGDLAKTLLVDLLAKHGAGIADIETWEVGFQGRRITFAGELSRSGLRRILSVLSSPVGPIAATRSSQASAEDAIAKASQRYFQAVTNYLNDLFLNDRQAASLYQAKMWVERYARKIEDLDDHQVDEEVIAFGHDVVGSLHEIVSLLDRSQQRSDLRESTMYNSQRRRYGRYGAYGFFEKSYAARDRQVVQADEASRGIRESQVIVDELRQLSAQTRQTMTERYDLPF